MWTRLELTKPFFNHGKYSFDALPVLFPGEVNRYTVLFITGTHPKMIPSDGAYLGNLQQRRNIFPQVIDAAERGKRILTWQDVLTGSSARAQESIVRAGPWAPISE